MIELVLMLLAAYVLVVLAVAAVTLIVGFVVAVWGAFHDFFIVKQPSRIVRLR